MPDDLAEDATPEERAAHAAGVAAATPTPEWVQAERLSRPVGPDWPGDADFIRYTQVPQPHVPADERAVEGPIVAGKQTWLTEKLDGEDLVAAMSALVGCKLAAVEAAYSRRFDRGAPHNFGTTAEPCIEHLQVSREVDKTNWLTLKDAIRDAFEEGLQDQPMMLPIRTTENINHPMTWAEGRAVVNTSIRSFGALMMGALWTKKAQLAAAAAAGLDALQAFDPESGWPA
jgi:hypothetical protein